MTRSPKLRILVLALAAAGLSLVAPTTATAGNGEASALAYWTHDRIATAIARDIEFEPGAQVGKLVTPAPTKGKGGGTTDGSVLGASWNNSGVPLNATGKVFFTMSGIRYVCSGSVVNDSKSDRSIVLSAGHCAWDEKAGAYATNWVFIPAFDANPNGSCDVTSGAGAFPYGCWTAEALFVHSEYAGETALTTKATTYDWSFAVMGLGGNQGLQLDAAIASNGGGFNLSTTAIALGKWAYAFGYPQARPYKGSDLTYSAGKVSEDPYTHATWGLGSNMTGGASGGPWIGTVDPSASTLPAYNTNVSSLNSYKYNGDKNHMYGPKFNSNTLNTFNAASNASIS